MGGFFNWFKNVGKSVDAKAQAQADKIEEENAVEFAKQDIVQMKQDLNSVKNNIGSIKGEVAVLENKIDDLTAKIKKHDSDAEELIKANMENLAEEHVEKAELLEKQVNSLKSALVMQKEVLEEQIDAKETLERAVTEAETSLTTLKAMTDAAKANEKLVQISSSSTTSATNSLKTRLENAEKKLIRSRSMVEGNEEESLEEKTQKALGKSGSSIRLERIKSKINGNA